MTQNPIEPSAIVGPAVTYVGNGGFDVIKVADRFVRPPAALEVRIKVAAAAVNPTDIVLRDPGQGNVPLPMTPGMDAAGIVEAVGAGEKRLAVGDEVMAALSPRRPEGGAQAAYIVVPSAAVVHKPRGLTFAEAATLPMNGLTALYALELAGLAAGQTLAVSGGAGWLACLAIGLAKHRGLRTLADAKPEEVELVRGYGADVVVERGRNFAQVVRGAVLDGVDALLDTALLGRASFPAIKDGGVYIPVRGWREGPDPRIQIKPVMVGEVLARTDWLETLRRLAETKQLVPRVAGEYPPQQVAQAQRRMMAGGVRGRLVIVF